MFLKLIYLLKLKLIFILPLLESFFYISYKLLLTTLITTNHHQPTPLQYLKKNNQLIKAPFAKTYNIIKTASHAASADLDLLSGEVRIEFEFYSQTNKTKNFQINLNSHHHNNTHRSI